MEKGISRKWNEEESKCSDFNIWQIEFNPKQSRNDRKTLPHPIKNPKGYCNSKYLCTKHKGIQIHKRNITVSKKTHQPSHLNSDWPQFLTPDNRQVLLIKQRNGWIEQHHKLSGPNSIYRTVHPNTKDHTFSSAVYRVSSKTDYIFGQKPSLNRYQKTEITPVPIWPLWSKAEHQQRSQQQLMNSWTRKKPLLKRELGQGRNLGNKKLYRIQWKWKYNIPKFTEHNESGSKRKFRAESKTLEVFCTNNVRTCSKALEKQEEIIPKRKKVIGKNNEVQS